MKERLLQLLQCPACAGGISLSSVERREENEIMWGKLSCESCKLKFPIVRGIPRFADPKNLESEKAATAASFGWSWTYFKQQDEKYSGQFLGWIAPVTRKFFKDKTVIEGGCGKGRHTRLAAKWGARDVVGVDLSEAVEMAFAATRGLRNAHIVQADIYNLPVKRAFDYGFSIGVLHHLPDPRAGLLSVAAKVRPGGYLSAWVYGAENNGWITRWVSPLREGLTSRINRHVLLHLSKLPTAVLYLTTKLVYRPLNRLRADGSLVRHLFYSDYLVAISDFGWREQHSIVFDHLVAPTAYYIPREEFEEWWHAVGAKEVSIGWHNKNSWRGFGRL
jgi:SAM-dependent methyltransferase